MSALFVSAAIARECGLETIPHLTTRDTTVMGLESIGLTDLMARLNRGEDYNGKPIDAPTSFFIGVAVNPTADDLDLELERFHRKLEAGAHFAMTQLLYDLRYF